MAPISVILFVFDDEHPTDITLEECLGSLGNQDCEPNQTEFVIVGDDITPEFRQNADVALSRIASDIRYVPVDQTNYSQNKALAFRYARNPIVAFADSDVMYPVCWLRVIEESLVQRGEQVVVGPPSFKPGSFLRTTLLLSDFGLLWEEKDYASFVNMHNLAIRRDILEQIPWDIANHYHRFGLPSYLSRQLQARGIPIRNDHRLAMKHGLAWPVWLGEKRLRRYAHNAYMAFNDPLVPPGFAEGSRPQRPLSWLKTWYVCAKTRVLQTCDFIPNGGTLPGSRQ